jgi:hypothetical protein
MKRQSKPDSAPVNYMLRIDREAWINARVRAITEGQKMSDLIRSFLQQYAANKYTPPAVKK